LDASVTLHILFFMKNNEQNMRLMYPLFVLELHKGVIRKLFSALLPGHHLYAPWNKL